MNTLALVTDGLASYTRTSLLLDGLRVIDRGAWSEASGHSASWETRALGVASWSQRLTNSPVWSERSDGAASWTQQGATFDGAAFDSGIFDSYGFGWDER